MPRHFCSPAGPSGARRAAGRAAAAFYPRDRSRPPSAAARLARGRNRYELPPKLRPVSTRAGRRSSRGRARRLKWIEPQGSDALLPTRTHPLFLSSTTTDVPATTTLVEGEPRAAIRFRPHIGSRRSDHAPCRRFRGGPRGGYHRQRFPASGRFPCRRRGQLDDSRTAFPGRNLWLRQRRRPVDGRREGDGGSRTDCRGWVSPRGKSSRRSQMMVVIGFREKHRSRLARAIDEREMDALVAPAMRLTFPRTDCVSPNSQFAEIDSAISRDTSASVYRGSPGRCIEHPRCRFWNDAACARASYTWSLHM